MQVRWLEICQDPKAFYGNLTKILSSLVHGQNVGKLEENSKALEDGGVFQWKVFGLLNDYMETRPWAAINEL